MKSTLSEGGDWRARLEFALHETKFGRGGDLIDELAIVCVRVHSQELLLRNQVCGLRGGNKKIVMLRETV